jgi:FkbM family methyltransferase
MSPVERIFELRFLLDRPNPLQKLIGAGARVFWMTFRAGSHPLARDRMLQTIGTTYLWQIWRRVLGRTVVVRLPEGSLLYCPPWSRMAGNYVTLGFDEFAETVFVLDYLKPGELFVDVGANIGFYSIIVAGSTGRVLAFEPIERARSTIRRSAALNRRSDAVEVCPRALSDWFGKSYFTANKENMNSLTQIAEGAIEVEVSTLDRELQSAPALIKIDAEGFDLSVLRGGAERVLPVYKPAIVVEIQADGSDTRQWLEAHEYAIFRYEPQSKSLEPFVARTSSPGAPTHDYAVAIHRHCVDDARARLAASAVRTLRPPSVQWFRGDG